MNRKREDKVAHVDSAEVVGMTADQLVLESKLPFLGYDIIDKIIIMTKEFQLAVALGREYCIKRMYKPTVDTYKWASQNGHLEVVKWLENNWV